MALVSIRIVFPCCVQQSTPQNTSETNRPSAHPKCNQPKWAYGDVIMIWTMVQTSEITVPEDMENWTE
jgi:hypothetical protein